ncbi:NmrA/HSCARG family protein [Herbiconiux sp. VKM Ac-2851]|uniref:NmrA/HSCARG family protein n=1 Tax=Herbiconiux sp. VKM Ac-2851 TaxID=2739025 RepID=UPI001566B5C8|nr:NmrA/HSCARG family protein [Herbiconiux sp. VKM Ac-2851]NQX37024.1 NmrA/HSCARG family protein [Herbiconiux sp. VKM Ac-2851]
MSEESPKTIAVFAATGSQGGAVADALLDAGATVRALLRDTRSEKAESLARRGVELVQIDVNDPTSLVSALEGADAFWFMTTPPGGMQNADTEGETRQGIALADAAAAARVPHVVFNSVGGADRRSGVPHFESKYRVEQHLAQLGLNTTIVRPVFFAENFLQMAPAVEDGTLVLRLPIPDAIPLQVIAVRDVGIIAAKALLDQASVPAAVEIAGDELTGSQIASIHGDRAGVPARYEALPVTVLDGQDDLQAMFRWFAETPAYQADLEQVRRIHPGTSTLSTWVAAESAPSAR